MGNDNRVTDLMIGLGLGLTIGVVTALLMAPESGRRTRRRLLRAGEDAIKTARNGMETVRDATSEQAHKLADTLSRT